MRDVRIYEERRHHNLQRRVVRVIVYYLRSRKGIRIYKGKEFEFIKNY